jgi:hypothetical protein
VEHISREVGEDNMSEIVDFNKTLDKVDTRVGDAREADALNSPEAIKSRKEIIEGMQRAENAVRGTMGPLNIIAGIQVQLEQASPDLDNDLTDGPRYIGELTMIGADDSLFGQSITGPEIKRREDEPLDKPIDSRRALAEILRELANVIYDNIEDHP